MPDRRAPSGVVNAARGVTLLLVAVLLHACETTLVTPVEIERVEVVPPIITLVEGGRETASAILEEASGQALSGGRVTWTIDDPRIASVTSAGVVEALAAGSTLVRASLGDVSGTAELRVLLGPTLELSAHVVSFEATPGDTGPKVAEVEVENAGAGSLGALTVRVEGSAGAAPWLAAELLTAAAPTLLRFRADPNGLEPGTYEALVTVASPTARAPAHIDVSLRVREDEKHKDDDEDDDEDDDDDDEDEEDRGPACEIRSDFISGDLRIPTNTRCVISDVYVAGNLQLDRGASLVGDDVRVDGNIESKHAAELTLTDALIFGNVRLEDGGSVSLRESWIAGKIELKSNGGSIEIEDNVIQNDAKLEDNRQGPIRLVGNTIDGKLECKDNDPPPTGGGNDAQQMTGQCSGL